MKKLIFLLPLTLLAQEDFISAFEYGQMLYSNPRGISCAQCHGVYGEGALIATYQDIVKDKPETKVIKGADIRYKTLEEIEDTVARDHQIMPKYYLTHEEVEAIYNFIQELNRREKAERQQ